MMRSVVWLIIVVDLLLGDALSAEVTNGDFENPGDPLFGWTIQGNVVELEQGTQHAASLKEEGGGPLSRIYQVFDPPATPTTLFFKYRLLYSQAPGNGKVLPPAFSWQGPQGVFVAVVAGIIQGRIQIALDGVNPSGEDRYWLTSFWKGFAAGAYLRLT